MSGASATTVVANDTDGASENRVLEVRDRSDALLVSLPVPQGEGWCLKWNHSVEGFPVLDCYRNEHGRMVLERSHQPDFAAGLGHVPGRGRQVSDGHGGYWIEGIHEPVPGDRYLLRVGAPRVNHRLVREDRTVSLSDLAAGQRVSIGLRPVPASDSSDNT
tara:strand:+ start:25084 stop:25566 length:483 start_codon:yes stop_codon:yes gene_type:complete